MRKKHFVIISLEEAFRALGREKPDFWDRVQGRASWKTVQYKLVKIADKANHSQNTLTTRSTLCLEQ